MYRAPIHGDCRTNFVIGWVNLILYDDWLCNISQFLSLPIGTYNKWPHPVTNYQILAFWSVMHRRFHCTGVFQNLCGKLFCDFFCWIIVTGFYILLWRCCILGEPKSRPKGYVPQGTFYSSLLGSACPKVHKKVNRTTKTNQNKNSKWISVPAQCTLFCKLNS